jgi:hypothetical protein
MAIDKRERKHAEARRTIVPVATDAWRRTHEGTRDREALGSLAWNHDCNHETDRADGVTRHTAGWNIAPYRPQSVEAIAWPKRSSRSLGSGSGRPARIQ